MEMSISKTRTGLWVLATIAAPLFFYWFASGWYIGAWYARTGHQGSPTGEIMMQAMFVGLPPALWAATGLWWWIHRKKASFSELFMTRTGRPEIDLLVGLALGTVWIVVYGLGDVVSWEAMFTFDAAKLASVPATLSAGFCEEFLFRGFLFWMLLAAGARTKSRVVASTLAFGFAHCFRQECRTLRLSALLADRCRQSTLRPYRATDKNRPRAKENASHQYRNRRVVIAIQ